MLTNVATQLRTHLDAVAACAVGLATTLELLHVTLPDALPDELDCDCLALRHDLDELLSTVSIVNVPVACFLDGLAAAERAAEEDAR